MPPGPFPFGRAAIIAILMALAACDVVYLFMWLTKLPQSQFGDFFGLWTWGKFATAAGEAIYDPSALQAFQHSLDPDLHGVWPFPYPPTFLLALAPLGMLPLVPAYVLWIAGTFALYLLATLGRHWRSLSGAALLLVPTTLLTVIAGHNGFLTATLLIGGLRCLKRLPVLAGVLLGLLTYKPQFGLIVLVVLLAAKAWRAITASVVTFIATFVASGAVFGWSIGSRGCEACRFTGNCYRRTSPISIMQCQRS
jgi:hypothetical protein